MAEAAAPAVLGAVADRARPDVRLIALLALASSIVQPVFGYLSDRTPHRWLPAPRDRS